jgi:hypothetical protein
MEKEMDKNKKEQYIINYKSLFILYLNECLEAFIAILVIRIAVDKGFDMLKIIKASMVIGLLTFILEHYNPDLKSNIKQGITFTAGSQIVNTFM